jgi:MYXO-CTERM domain-containing protein
VEHQSITPKNHAMDKLARALLATTCLTGASGVASATAIVVVEGQGSAPTDFPNSSPGYLLPVGTTEVQGQLHGTTDTKDWIEFQDLAPGQGFSLHGFYTPLHQEKGVTFQTFTTSNVQFGNSSLEGMGRPINGIIPSNGEIIVEIQFAQTGSPAYEFEMTANVDMPEPSTLATAGLALAGALAWRRKRSQRA